MELFWWVVTIVLFAVGLIGTIAPVLPGTTIILAAAVIHRIMLGPEKSIGWRTIIVLVLLTLATYAIDVFGGYFGAKYFGATKWGTFGAIAGEFIAGKQMIDAGRAGWGSLLGNLGAMVGKLVIGLAMIAIFFLTAPTPF